MAIYIEQLMRRLEKNPYEEYFFSVENPDEVVEFLDEQGINYRLEPWVKGLKLIINEKEVHQRV